MKKTISLFILLLIASISIYGQNNNTEKIKGTVTEISENGEISPLVGANVFYSDYSNGVTTDKDGNFQIRKPKKNNQFIIITFVGYQSDTIYPPFTDDNYNINLKTQFRLNAIQVVSRQENKTIDRMNPVWSQQLNQGELLRCACCNLSEGFETNASVDVNYTDAVTGAKQIHLLGLSGIYTQMLVGNLPFMRGIGTTFGLEFIPGSWMESIQISKGTASINNGYESLTGQINTEYKKPEDSERFFFNYFLSSHGRQEFNINASHRFNNKLSSILLAHHSFNNIEFDHNKDGFIDAPISKQYNIANLWTYNSDKGYIVRAGIKFVDDKRSSGQLTESEESSSLDLFKSDIQNRNYEFFSKVGKVFNNKQGTSIGWQNVLNYQEMKSDIGKNLYDAKQFSWYSNLLYNGVFKNPKHSYTTGISLIYDDINQMYNNINGNVNEVVGGAFYQYTFSIPEKISILAAMRADYSNLHKLFLTPRFHFKYFIDMNTTLRLVAGYGYRTPNIIPENMAALSSSRIVFNPFERFQEQGINTGASIVKSFEIFGKRTTITADYYYTYFIKNAYLDFEKDTNYIFTVYSDKKSFSNVAQIEASINLLENLNINSAFRYTNVLYTPNETLVEKPMTSKYKAFLSINYATNLKKWQFDATTQWIGKSKLPDRSIFAEPYRVDDYSPSFWLLSGQVIKNFRYWSVYLGVENAMNFKQENPIINPENPFSNSFDSSIIWGPIMGRKIYAGIRINLPYIEKIKEQNH